VFSVLIKSVRLFEKKFGGMEALIRNLKLFQSFLNIFSIEMRLFLQGGFFKEFEVF
jgi:hypothetical protein